MQLYCFWFASMASMAWSLYNPQQVYAVAIVKCLVSREIAPGLWSQHGQEISTNEWINENLKNLEKYFGKLNKAGKFSPVTHLFILRNVWFISFVSNLDYLTWQLVRSFKCGIYIGIIILHTMIHHRDSHYWNIFIMISFVDSGIRFLFFHWFLLFLILIIIISHSRTRNIKARFKRCLIVWGTT